MARPQFRAATWNCSRHLKSCTLAQAGDTEHRVDGWFRRCVTCGAPMVVHLATMETPQGFLKPDVVKWLAECMRPLAEEDGIV